MTFPRLAKLATIRLHPALVAGMLTAGLLGGVHIGTERAERSNAPWDRLIGAACNAFQVLAQDTLWPVSAEYTDTCERINGRPAPVVDRCTGALIAAGALHRALRGVDGLEMDERHADLFHVALAIQAELRHLRTRRDCPDGLSA